MLFFDRKTALIAADQRPPPRFDNPPALAYIRRTRRESAPFAVVRSAQHAAPPKGHTRKLSGKRTERVEKPALLPVIVTSFE
jgi:hypothetical protein